MVMGKSETPPEPVLSIEERNALLKKHYHAIVSKPKFKPQQMVQASELGLEVRIPLEEGQFAVVARVGQEVADDAGVDSKNSVEIQFFNKQGHFIRMACDPRYLKEK